MAPPGLNNIAKVYPTIFFKCDTENSEQGETFQWGVGEMHHARWLALGFEGHLLLPLNMQALNQGCSAFKPARTVPKFLCYPVNVQPVGPRMPVLTGISGGNSPTEDASKMYL